MLVRTDSIFQFLSFECIQRKGGCMLLCFYLENFGFSTKETDPRELLTSPMVALLLVESFISPALGMMAPPP